MIGHKFYI